MNETEYKIIEAAKQVFLEKGLENAKMQDIADRAGISRTSLNYYYRTKENLFGVLAEQMLDSILPQISVLSIEEGDAQSITDKIVDIYIDLLCKNEYIPRFVFVEIQRNPQLLRDFVAQNKKAQLYLNTLGQLLDKNMKAGDMRHIPFHQVVSVFFGLLFSPFLFIPLLELYWNENKEMKNQFFKDYKNTVKRLMKSFLESPSEPMDMEIAEN
jgi:Transcriptional regulator